MVSFCSSRTSRPALRPGRKISIQELDLLLTVPEDRFDETVAELTRRFLDSKISVWIPGASEGVVLQPVDSRVDWVRLYEAQVRRLGRLDRDDEFKMARRYEFLRARAGEALRRAGHDPERIAELLADGEAPGAADDEPQRLAAGAVAELRALRNRFIEGALYMVPSCAQRYRNLGVDLADLIQEGNASLFQAIDGFDWRRQVRFKTYAQYWIHQAMLKVLYNSSRTVRVPIWVQKALSKIRRVRERELQALGESPTDDAVGAELGMSGERVRELLDTRRYTTSLDLEVKDDDGASLGQLLPDHRAVPVEEAIADGDLGACLDEVMADLPSREQLILQRRYGLNGRPPETLGEIASDLGITAERVRQLQNAALHRLQKPTKVKRLRAYAG